MMIVGILIGATFMYVWSEALMQLFTAIYVWAHVRCDHCDKAFAPWRLSFSVACLEQEAEPIHVACMREVLKGMGADDKAMVNVKSLKVVLTSKPWKIFFAFMATAISFGVLMLIASSL